MNGNATARPDPRRGAVATGDASGTRRPVVDLAKFDGAVFDLDGVVTRTARLHAATWKVLFDDFLARRAAAGGSGDLRPFDAREDYLAHVDGKPRYDGVRSFLASRGITLPEGSPDDGPDRDTVHGLGNRKNAIFHERLAQDGVEVFETSVAFIESIRTAGLATALVSSSKNAGPVLEAAGLTGLFDARVDGIDAERLRLRGKPAPDLFVTGAERIGVAPARGFVVEDALAGVAAGRAGHFGLVIGVDRTGEADELRANGADIVVNDLAEIRLVHS